MSGSGSPKQITADPTPIALRPLQALLAQGMMQQLGTPTPGVPTAGLPNFGNIFQQLYGGGAPGAPAQGSGIRPPQGGAQTSLPNMGRQVQPITSGSRTMYSMMNPGQGSMPSFASVFSRMAPWGARR